MNEFQVSIGETTYGGRHELSHQEGAIVDYGSLIYITLQRAKTAREAIKIMDELTKEYGYYSEGESFSISDPNEVWIMEVIGKGNGHKGMVWVARKIPDGYISAHANQARITTFPLNDPDNCLYSPDVIDFAREKGYYSGADKDFSFADAYAPLDFGAIRFCEARVWSIFRRANSSMEKYISYINGESLERMPLWVKPDNKLTVAAAMSLMRDHYEGTELDMTVGVDAGQYGSPYRWRPLTYEYDGVEYYNERPISTPQTAFSFISQMRSWLPNMIGGIIWFGVDDTYMTVYIPMYCDISKIPYNFAVGTGSFNKFDWESAFWKFNFVSNMVYPKYSLMVGDVKAAQSFLEGQFMAQQAETEAKAAQLYKQSPAEAREYLTQYSLSCARQTVKEWTKLAEKLIFKYNDGTVRNEFNAPKSPGYPDAWKEIVVKERGDRFKMKKVEGEDGRAYAAAVTEGDNLLKDKKYEEAKEAYAKASGIYPNENYPKERIQAIDKITSEMNDLYNKYFNEKTAEKK
jgi:dipeptidase